MDTVVVVSDSSDDSSLSSKCMDDTTSSLLGTTLAVHPGSQSLRLPHPRLRCSLMFQRFPNTPCLFVVYLTDNGCSISFSLTSDSDSSETSKRIVYVNHLSTLIVMNPVVLLVFRYDRIIVLFV